ncbi:MAG: acyl-CoA dehydrogenase family protein [Actinomycetota bacterium]
MSALAQVDAAIDDLIATHDPQTTDDLEFRGHQFDAGLGIVNFGLGHGGLGLEPGLQKHIERRLIDAGRAPEDPRMFFRFLAGPTIHTHGSDDVKRRFLRPMFTGHERWCQLFSEPGAGSDFAGLGTRAVRDGDEWVVNGQKVWNSLAHLADFGMLVTRTDPDLPKHKGMTYFALDMRSPGVEVRPLRQITGEAEFNEVYMSDVRVPDDCRVGEVGEGWRASLTTLMNERTELGGGTPAKGSGPIASLVDIWTGLDDAERTPVARDLVTRLWAQAEALRLTNMRAAQARRSGNPGPEGSVGKAIAAGMNKAIFETCIDLLGPAGMVDFEYSQGHRRTEDMGDSGGMTGGSAGPRHAFLRTRANSIEGGTSEIMRNILGEQVLGLPGEPRVDKDVAWIDVPRN